MLISSFAIGRMNLGDWTRDHEVSVVNLEPVPLEVAVVARAVPSAGVAEPGLQIHWLTPPVDPPSALSVSRGGRLSCIATVTLTPAAGALAVMSLVGGESPWRQLIGTIELRVVPSRPLGDDGPAILAPQLDHPARLVVGAGQRLLSGMDPPLDIEIPYAPGERASYSAIPLATERPEVHVEPESWSGSWSEYIEDVRLASP
jgi:hypothetical protein